SESVLEKVPDAARNGAVVAVHPKTVARSAARDMNLDHTVERSQINLGEGIDAVIQRVAMHIVKIEQQEASTLPHDGIDQADVIANLGIRRQVGDIVGGILEKERNPVAPADFGGPLRDEIGSFFGGRDGKRNSNLEGRAVVAGNGLKSEMLTVP